MKVLKKIISISFICISIVGCVDREAQKQAKRTQNLLEDKSQSVLIDTAKIQELIETLTITGNLIASDDTNVGSKISGRIVSILVKDGDPVKIGQVIATIDTADILPKIQQAQASVMSAQSDINQAILNAKIGPSSTTASVAAAKAQYNQAKAQYNKVLSGGRKEEQIQAKAAIDTATSNLNVQKRELDRAKTLLKAGAVSAKTLDLAQLSYDTAASQLKTANQQFQLVKVPRPEDIEAAKQMMEAAEQSLQIAIQNKNLDPLLQQKIRIAQANYNSALSGLKLAQQQLQDAVIRSPYTGRVSGNPVQVGTVVGPGSVIARIISLNKLYVQGDVPESAISYLQMGQQAEITIPALNNYKTQGRVIALNPYTDKVARLFTARIELNKGASNMSSNMFATAKIKLKAKAGVTVATQSIVQQLGKHYVFVVAGKYAKQVEVQTGIVEGQWTQVTGLKAGEKIIIQGQENLKDGDLIKIQYQNQSIISKKNSIDTNITNN